MAKLLLSSILLATIVIPAIAARTPDRRKAMKQVLFWSAAYFVAYMAAMQLLYFRLL